MEQMGVDDLTAYLESLPSPSVFGPAGVGSQASHTPSTDGARTPIVGVLAYRRRQELDPLPVGGAHACWRPPVRVVGLEVVEVGEVVVAVPPVDDRDEDEDDAHDALNPLPPCLGRPPVAPNKRPLLER